MPAVVVAGGIVCPLGPIAPAWRDCAAWRRAARIGAMSLHLALQRPGQGPALAGPGVGHPGGDAASNPHGSSHGLPSAGCWEDTLQKAPDFIGVAEGSRALSAVPPKADMCSALADVRFVPIADIDHSMITSTRCRNLSGMLSPRAFAVFRLMTSSYFVGCSTGMSFGPLP